MLCVKEQLQVNIKIFTLGKPFISHKSVILSDFFAIQLC